MNLVQTVAVEDDNRFFINVSVLGKLMIGLLDSGATITVLNSYEIISNMGLPLYPVTTVLTIADGTKHHAKHYADVPYVFNNNCFIVPTLIVPGFKHKLLLGISFWKAFNIKPCQCDAKPTNIEVLEFSGLSKF